MLRSLARVAILMSAITATVFSQSSQQMASLSSGVKEAVAKVTSSESGALALAETLPKNAIAYARIPHPISFLTQAKGTALDPALKTDQNIEAIAALKSNLAKLPISDLPPGAQRMVALLIEKMESPIELALIGTELPPTVMARTTVNCQSSRELQGYLDNVFKGSPIFIIKQPFNAEGQAEVTAGPVQIHFDFDTATRVLNVIVGLEKELASLKTELSSSSEHGMKELEGAIDPGRHGLFIWQDNDKLADVLQKVDESYASYLRLISNGSEGETAFGWGTRDGHGHLGLVLKAPSPFITNFLTTGEDKISFASAGIPQRVFIFSTQLLKTGLDLSLGMYKESDKSAPIPELLGDVSQLLGGELLFVSDKAGSYAALRVGSPEKAEKLLKKLKTEKYIDLDEFANESRKFFHVAYKMGNFASEEKPTYPALQKYIQSMLSTHTYISFEGDYMLIGNLPQVLYDRFRSDERMDVNDWISEAVGQQNQPLLSYIEKSSGNASAYYYSYLSLLQALGNDLGVPIYKFPSASQIDFPDQSVYSATLQFKNNLLFFDTYFENSPFDILINGNPMTAALLVGVAAAVGIPAFAEYGNRVAEHEKASAS